MRNIFLEMRSAHHLHDHKSITFVTQSTHVGTYHRKASTQTHDIQVVWYERAYSDASPYLMRLALNMWKTEVTNKNL